MRNLVLSDIHSNLAALEACLLVASEAGYGRVLCLGDLVGYAASPKEVLALLRALDTPVKHVRGNHDKVVSGLGDSSHFNPDAQSAARWNQEALDFDELKFLKDLPEGPLDAGNGIVLSHGSPDDEEAYLMTEHHVEEAFAAFKGTWCFFGHIHVPMVLSLDADTKQVSAYLPADSTRETASPVKDPAVRVCPVTLPETGRHLINPGSVGQPRDQNPAAGFAIFDDATGDLEFYRVPYDIGDTQRRIREAGLPDAMAERLVQGL